MTEAGEMAGIRISEFRFGNLASSNCMTVACEVVGSYISEFRMKP